MNRGVILIAVLTLVITGEVKDINAKKGPAFTPLIAGFGAGFFLFIINAVNADLARLMSILVILGALAVNGPELFKATGNIVKGGKNG